MTCVDLHTVHSTRHKPSYSIRHAICFPSGRVGRVPRNWTPATLGRSVGRPRLRNTVTTGVVLFCRGCIYVLGDRGFENPGESETAELSVGSGGLLKNSAGARHVGVQLRVTRPSPAWIKNLCASFVKHNHRALPNNYNSPREWLRNTRAGPPCACLRACCVSGNIGPSCESYSVWFLSWLLVGGIQLANQRRISSGKACVSNCINTWQGLLTHCRPQLDASSGLVPCRCLLARHWPVLWQSEWLCSGPDQEPV